MRREARCLVLSELNRIHLRTVQVHLMIFPEKKNEIALLSRHCCCQGAWLLTKITIRQADPTWGSVQAKESPYQTALRVCRMPFVRRTHTRHYLFCGAGFWLFGVVFGAFGNREDTFMLPPVYPLLLSPPACRDWSCRARVLSASRLI
jgi:hypothetical protein